MTRYAIIENEKLSRISLIDHINQLRPDWILSFTGETVEECVTFLSSDEAKNIDLVFLDIELDDGNCFDILRQLAYKSTEGGTLFDVPVIFTTSYDKYALQAFQVNSVDYLLKPVLKEDLLRAIKKWERTHEKSIRQPINTEQLLKTFTTWLSSGSDLNTARHTTPRDNKKTTASEVTRILINSGNSYRYIETEEVAFFLAEDKGVYAVTKENGRKFLTDLSNLGDLMPVLPENYFFQLSRSVIANIQSVAKVSKYFKGRLSVTLNAGEIEHTVTITAARKQDFLSWYGYRS